MSALNVAPPPPPMFNVTVDGVTTGYDVLSYAGEDGTAALSADGTTVTLSDNAWNRIEMDAVITENTVLTFDYYGESLAEIHAIGFDTDNSFVYDDDIGQFFLLEGTQKVGIQDFDGTYGGGWQSYTINIGQFYTGSFQNLVLAVDDDAGTAGIASFANIIQQPSSRHHG